MTSEADLSHGAVHVTGADICQRSFWRALAPHLHVDGLEPGGPTVPRQDFARLQKRMLKDGYFGDRDERLVAMAPAIGRTAKRLVEIDLPPVFTWVYDEPWECYRRLAPVISHFLGADYKLLPDFWTWHVDPRNNEAGWRPHRDKGPKSLAPDGSPLSLTCWIPLGDANPLNSCIYIVPAHLDPNYNGEGPETLMAPYARALPGKPGDFFIWNQAVMHWGSLSSEFADEPRMSMALEFQRGDAPPFRPHLIDSRSLPTFATRLRLIGQQILQYTHMYGMPEGMVRIAQFIQQAAISDA